jgi:hypothetical protein
MMLYGYDSGHSKGTTLKFKGDQLPRKGAGAPGEVLSELGHYPRGRREHIANVEQIVYTPSTINLSSAAGEAAPFVPSESRS